MQSRTKILRKIRVLTSMMISVFLIMAASCGGFVDDPSVAPSVVFTVPADSETDVELSSTISATFSKPMDLNTINNSSFFVEDRTDPNVDFISGSVTYSEPDQTATFMPAALLTNATKYRITFTRDITDLFGNPLKLEPTEVDFNWDFITK